MSPSVVQHPTYFPLLHALSLLLAVYVYMQMDRQGRQTLLFSHRPNRACDT